jgi:hypothetical protein
MSRSSSKCCDHVEKTRFRVQNHPLYFYFYPRAATGGCFALPELAFFPEFASGSSLPAAGSYHSGSLRPRLIPAVTR